MWSEYSRFFGCCLRFSSEKLLRAFGKRFAPIHDKVVYGHDEQKSIVEEAIERDYLTQDECQTLNTWDDFDGLAGDDLDLFCRHVAGEIGFLSMFFKRQCFSGETSIASCSCAPMAASQLRTARSTVHDSTPHQCTVPRNGGAAPMI